MVAVRAKTKGSVVVRVAVSCALSVLCLAHSRPARAQAQTQMQTQTADCPTLTTMPIDSAAAANIRPDVMIHASATAKSVTFNGQPVVNVRFRGCGIRDTVRVLERTNLPKPVVSGVTYNNVRVAVELYAYFDVECILSQLTAPADSAGRTTARTCRRKQ